MTLAEASRPSSVTTADTEFAPSSLPNNEDRRTNLENIFKEVIWNFSSSINHRRPFLREKESSAGTSTGTATSRPYAGLWNDLMMSRVKEYQKKYVQQRMVR